MYFIISAIILVNRGGEVADLGLSIAIFVTYLMYLIIIFLPLIGTILAGFGGQ